MLIWEKYKRKSEIIETIKYKGGFVHGVVTLENGEGVIRTKSGEISVNKGDFIVKGDKGEYFVLPAAEIEKNFVPVPNAGDIEYCPCCGSTAAVVAKEQDPGKVQLFYVRCDNKECRMRTKTCKSKQEAIQLWNKRT